MESKQEVTKVVSPVKKWQNIYKVYLIYLTHLHDSRVDFSTLSLWTDTFPAEKRVREKSRECHNHKRSPSQTPRGRGNRENQTSITYETYEKHYLFPERGNRNAKRTEKHKRKNNTR